MRNVLLSACARESKLPAPRTSPGRQHLKPATIDHGDYPRDILVGRAYQLGSTAPLNFADEFLHLGRPVVTSVHI
jgi:hypothetical protein